MRDNGFNLLLVVVIVTATESILVINALSTCPKNKITVKEPHHQCIPCASCPEGQELYPPCGSQITEQERLTIKFECKNCKPGHYSDEYDIYPCKECHNCLDNQPVIKKCTNTSDTICHKLCNKGYYFENSSLDCERCSCCCGDSKDVKIKKCISDGDPESNQLCSSHRAQECCKATPQSTVASEQPTAKLVVERLSDADIAWIVVGILAFVLIIFLIGVILIWKCRGRNERNAGKRQDSEKTSRRYTRSESTSCTSLNDVLTKRFSALKRSDDKEVLFHEEWEVHLPENMSESCNGEKIISTQLTNDTKIYPNNLSNTAYVNSAPGTPTTSLSRIPNNKSLEKRDVRLPKNKFFKLGDLNGVQRENIEKMLDYQAYGVGSTKKLATLYKMDKYDIEKMLKESNAAEELLEYINAKFPQTTVYEFCEDLQRIGRNDIVKELCSYLPKVDQEL